MSNLAPDIKRNSSKRRVLVVLIPLLALAADYVFFPVFRDAEEKGADISLLLSQQTQLLGTFLGHHVYASIDDIQNPGFLSQLNQKGNALVVSAFASGDDKRPPSSGALLRSVQQKLQRVSPNDHRKLVDSLERKGGLAAGDVLPVRLSLPVAKHREFPIDVLLILFFDSSVESEDLQKGMKTVLNLARTEKTSNLIIPCAGTSWESNHSLGFKEFFDAVFADLSAGDSPFGIYLSLYERWPSFVLEDAVASLNSSWHASFQQPNKISLIYRRDFRLTLIFLSLCLLVCSFYAPLTVKNTLIIVVSFVSIGLGSKQLLDFFVQGQSALAGFMLQLGVLAVLAFGFPVIINWSPKNIFKKETGEENGGG